MLPGQRQKNRNKMKKYFLLAVALSALCSSCETEDETINSTNLLNAGKSSDHIAVYRNCINSFVYDPSNLFEENMYAFETHVNKYIEEEQDYATFNLDTFIQLQDLPYDVLHGLNYSDQFKMRLIKIINNEGFYIPENSLSEKETRLLHTLSNIQDGNGDGLWNKKRTIAFAYGAQYSFKQAVLYSGAIELSPYNNSTNTY